MTKISIALCTYNGQRFLREQLESIRSQSRQPDELVVGDDGSSDRTVEIVREFAAKADFPVQLEINSENLGSTRNFEKTILRCSGELIFLADQDDVWMPEKIAAITSVFERSPYVGLVFSDATLIDENGQDLPQRLWDFTFPRKRRANADPAEFHRTLLTSNVVTGATAAFRSRMVSGCLPFPTDIPNLIHDGWLSLVISVSTTVRWLETPLIKYRQHAGQQLGIGYGEEIDGSMPERFAKTIGFLRIQLNAIDRVSEALVNYPALAVGRKVEKEISMIESEIKAYIVHLENRLRLLNRQTGRFPLIAGELRSGRYHRFSKGFRSSIKDLLYNS